MSDEKPARTRRAPVSSGDVFGRYTVLRATAPARTGGQSRQRVVVRCVCGKERILFVRDLTRGRATGCASIKCWHRHELQQATSAERRRMLEVIGQVLSPLIIDTQELARRANLILEGDVDGEES